MSSSVDRDLLDAKMRDAMTPGMEVELSPDETDYVGAFTEDAISIEDAREAMFDPR